MDENYLGGKSFYLLIFYLKRFLHSYHLNVALELREMKEREIEREKENLDKDKSNTPFSPIHEL